MREDTRSVAVARSAPYHASAVLISVDPGSACRHHVVQRGELLRADTHDLTVTLLDQPVADVDVLGGLDDSAGEHGHEVTLGVSLVGFDRGGLVPAVLDVIRRNVGVHPLLVARAVLELAGLGVEDLDVGSLHGLLRAPLGIEDGLLAVRNLDDARVLQHLVGAVGLGAGVVEADGGVGRVAHV